MSNPREELTQRGYPRIAGGQTAWAIPDWANPFIDPLPNEYSDYIKAQTNPYTPEVFTAVLAVLGALVAPELAAVLSAINVAYTVWYSAEQPSNPTTTVPEIDLPALPPDTYYPVPGLFLPQPGASQDYWYNPATSVRSFSAGSGIESLGNAIWAVTNLSRLLFYPGYYSTSIGAQGTGPDGEAEILSAVDGASVTITVLPSKYGGVTFGGDAWYTPRLGTLAFGIDGYWDERQKIEHLQGLYVPRNISQANMVRIKVKPGVEADLVGMQMWLQV